MSVVRLALVLAAAWVALAADVSPGTVATGLVAGLLVALYVRPAATRVRARRRAPRLLRLLRFVLYFGFELVRSSLRVAWRVLGPLSSVRPAVLSVPIDARSDAEILLLSSLVTLTPGSVCLGVSADRTRIQVHVLDTDDPDRVRAEIRRDIEAPLLELMR